MNPVFNFIWIILAAILTITGCAKTHNNSNQSLLLEKIKEDYQNSKKAEFYIHNKSVSGKLILRDKKNSIVPVDSIFTGNPKIILRYSNANCYSCIEDINNAIIKLSNKKDLIILLSYENFRAFSSFSRVFKDKFQYYLLNPGENELSGTCFDQYLPPYFFIGDSEMKIKYPFVPFYGLKEEINFIEGLFAEKLISQN